MSVPLWPMEPARSFPVMALVPAAASASAADAVSLKKTGDKLKSNGWAAAVLVRDDGSIIFGADEVLAAAGMAADGLKKWETAPVVVASGWTDDQIRAYGDVWHRRVYLGNQFGINTDLIGFEPEDFKPLFWDGLRNDKARKKTATRKPASSRGRKGKAKSGSGNPRAGKPSGTA